MPSPITIKRNPSPSMPLRHAAPRRRNSRFFSFSRRAVVANRYGHPSLYKALIPAECILSDSNAAWSSPVGSTDILVLVPCSRRCSFIVWVGANTRSHLLVKAVIRDGTRTSFPYLAIQLTGYSSEAMASYNLKWWRYSSYRVW